jgi:peptide/nickel transport system permease protein
VSQTHLEPEAVDDDPTFSEPVPASDIIGRSPGQIFWRRFRKDKLAFAGVFILILIVLLALAAPLFAKLVGHPVNEQYVFDMTTPLGVPLGPTTSNSAGVFIFGADGTARDLFIRVLYGAQTSLIVALTATGIELLLGVTLGIMAGFYRGKVDSFITGLTDIFFALPTLLLMLGIVGACGAQPPGQECLGGLLQPGRGLVAFVIGVFGWPYLARIIRGQVLSIREKEFIEASRSLGASNRRIMFKEILPNVLAPIIVYTTLIIPTNILIEASLSFLGIGVPPSIPSWGAALNEATAYYRIAWWMMLFPGLFLFATTLAFNLVGDGLRDAFDPKTA